MITSTDNTDVIITRADGRVARPRGAVSASIDLDEAPEAEAGEAGEDGEADLEATTFV